MQIEKAFAIIDAEHESHARVGNIGPGASTRDLDLLEGACSFNLPADFKKILQWHNGQPTHVNLFLFGPYRFHDIQTILEINHRETKSFLIFADDGGTTMLAINALGEVFELAEDGEVRLFSSPTDLLTEIAKDITNGNLQYDPNSDSYDTNGWPRARQHS